MSAKIQLYDLGRRDEDTNTSWSFNVWKTRLALNYKSMLYTTCWVDHNTLGPTLSSLGVPRNNGPGFPYTVPTVRLPDDRVVTDSAAIAKELEALQPQPSLRLDSELEAEVGKIIHSIAMPLFPIYMPAVARNVISPATVPAFAAPREKNFGMSLDELERTRGGEDAWKAAQPGLEKLKIFLCEKKFDAGPFVRGSRVCYADFMVVALFEALKKPDEHMFERIMQHDVSFKKVYNACSPWLENDK